MRKAKLLGWSIAGVLATMVGIGVGVSSTFASSTITHNPLTATDIAMDTQFGLTLSSTSETPAIDEVKALAATNSLLKDFKATSRNIILVSVTRHHGTGFAIVSPSIANGDPHITDKGGNLENVPAYLVTLNGVAIPSQGPNGGTFTSLNVLVDATNNNILMVYGYRNDK